jgi:hypothetical protein
MFFVWDRKYPKWQKWVKHVTVEKSVHYKHSTIKTYYQNQSQKRKLFFVHLQKNKRIIIIQTTIMMEKFYKFFTTFDTALAFKALYYGMHIMNLCYIKLGTKLFPTASFINFRHLFQNKNRFMLGVAHKNLKPITKA